MATRIPHTYRRNGIYYIRLKWPAKTRRVLPRLGHEFNCSLKTHDAQQAQLLTYACALQFKQLNQYIDSCIASGTISDLASLEDAFIALLKRALHSDTRKVSPMSETLVPELDNRIEIVEDPNTGVRTYRSDLSDPNENMDEVIQFESRRRVIIPGGGGGHVPIDSGPTVQEVAEDLKTELRKSGDWGTKKTDSQGTHRLGVIVQFLGPEKPIKSVKRVDVVGVRKKVMARVDPNRTRRSPKDGTLGLDTARSYFQLCGRLFKYALDQSIIDSNPASDMKLTMKKSNQTNNSYRPFSDEDLDKLVNGYIYHSTELDRARSFNDAHFWAPLLALYTGGRVNEICQLCVKDVLRSRPLRSEKARIWYININDDEVNQSVKSAASLRNVPIHDDLIQLGFIDFYEARAKQVKPNDQLFEEMVHCSSNGWGRQISRWFNGEGKFKGYLDAVQLTSREKKTFHSFRHTAVQCLRDAGVDEAAIAATVGHEHKSTTGIYGSGYALSILKGVIDKLDYGLDLSHISYAEFLKYKACKGQPEKKKHLLYASKKK